MAYCCYNIEMSKIYRQLDKKILLFVLKGINILLSFPSLLKFIFNCINIYNFKVYNTDCG